MTSVKFSGKTDQIKNARKKHVKTSLTLHTTEHFFLEHYEKKHS